VRSPVDAVAARAVIAVCKPMLPSADHLLPYLRSIDASRQYANRGPLVRGFEARLAHHAGGSADQIAVAANATAALTAILLSLDIPRGRSCMVPAWSFAASAHAVVQAGLIPWFVDVSASDGALCPESAECLASHAPGHLGAVLAVSPFGLPVPVNSWESFRHRTGVPVVVDAAAAFDSVRVSSLPTAVSLHATKALGVGEGAFVAWDDPAGVQAVRERINFGFSGSREAIVLATNAKLSEYSAAVGLAALDQWRATRAALRAVAREYSAALAGLDVEMQPGFGRQWISATTIVRVPLGSLAAVVDGLTEAGIETRRWWGDGLARQRAFAAFPRTALPVTSDLAATTVGLPCWPDLPSEAIRSTGRVIGARLERGATVR
jgi:dTDP-4-amino-4,6-dideoxygalactose transaminase